MTDKFSQTYSVDNRFRGLEDAIDDSKGPEFLAQYLKQRKQATQDNISEQRLGDDRFFLGGEGGTIPVTSLPYEPRGSASIGNTDRSSTFRNSFRAQPS